MMKKIIIILILLLLCGCSRTKNINININEVSNITYDEIKIINSDYSSIIDQINNKELYHLIDNNITGEKILINTISQTYNFTLKDDYLIYTVDSNSYFTQLPDLNKLLHKYKEIYLKNNFYTVDNIYNYNINDADIVIKLDNSNNCIIIKSELNIYNFQIKNNNNLVSNNSLDLLKEIDANKTICIQTSNASDIKIFFDTPYNYIVSIYYNNGFIKEFKAK